MPHLMESQLDLLDREVDAAPGESAAERAAGLSDLVALHLAVYDVLEGRLGTQGVTEAHRPLVPLFRQWLQTARRIVASARELRQHGHAVARMDDLLRAMNRSKPVAERFDYFVKLNERIARGEYGT